MTPPRRAPRAATTALGTRRSSIKEIVETKRSMLGAVGVPLEYSVIETTGEALARALTTPKDPVLRITIVWDNHASTLDLERALAHLRETGAALVTSAEEVEL